MTGLCGRSAASSGRCRSSGSSADIGRVTGPEVHELAAACDAGRIMFVRHLTVEIGTFDELPPGYELAEMILAELPEYPKALAVQAWTDSAGTGGSYYHRIEEALERARGRRDALRAGHRGVVLRRPPGGAARGEPAGGQPVGLAGWADAVGSRRGAGVAVGVQAGGGDRDLRAGAADGREGARPGRLAGRLDADSAAARAGGVVGGSRRAGPAAARRPADSSRGDDGRPVLRGQPGAVRRGGERHADGSGDERPDDAGRR